MSKPTADDFLTIGPGVRVLPIVHGSGDCAIRVRDDFLAVASHDLRTPMSALNRKSSPEHPRRAASLSG